MNTTKRQTMPKRRMKERFRERRFKSVFQETRPVTELPEPKGTRIIVLGGAEEVGRNMTVIETRDDIVIVDCGLQFPEEDMPGVDYVIPNITYLRGKEKKIRGIIITHGHYDHIGGLPHIASRLLNPPIYGTRLTNAIIAKRQTDFQEYGDVVLREIDPDKPLTLGRLKIDFFRVNHNIPDCVGMVIHTPDGSIMHTGDMKFDHTPVMDKPAELGKMARLGEQGVDLLLSDSTNAMKAGHQLSERAIGKELLRVFEEAEGRIIIGTFASLLSRVQQILWFAEQLDRKVVVEGYSMRTNVEIAKELQYLDVKPRTLISPQQGLKMPPEKLIILATGAQGEDRAALMRIANGEHRFWKVEKGDTVVFSSSVVPGNERSVVRVQDNLLKRGAHVFHYQMMDIHAGGHMQYEDVKLLFNLVNPHFIAPIMGEHHMLRAAEKAALELGWNPEQILITLNGQVMEMVKGNVVLTEKRVPWDYVFVDGLGVGDVSNVVLRDRQQMAKEGMVVIIASIDENGKLVGSPDILSRGFVYMKSSKDLIDETRKRVEDILRADGQKSAGSDVYLKNKLRDDIGLFLFEKTERRPMILPVFIEV